MIKQKMKEIDPSKFMDCNFEELQKKMLRGALRQLYIEKTAANNASGIPIFNEPDEDFFIEAEKLFGQGDFTGAAAAYTKGIDVYKISVMDENISIVDTIFFNQRGLAYQMMGEHDRAITDFSTAVSLNKTGEKCAGNYINRANSYFKKGELDKAVNDCYNAIELGYYYGPAYNCLGDAYSLTGKDGLAINMYKTAADHNDRTAMENLKKKGIEYTISETVEELCEKWKNTYSDVNDKNTDEAIAVLSISADKNHLESMRMLGFIYDIIKKDFEKGTYWYAKVAELGDLKNIDFIESIFRLGEHFMEGKGVPQDLIKAKTLFEKVIASGTPDYQRWSKMRLKKIRTMINKSI